MSWVLPMAKAPKIATSGSPGLTTHPFAALQGAHANLPDGPGTVSEPDAECLATASDPAEAWRGAKIVIRREKKGRGGKTATILEGVPDEASGALLRTLQKVLACGGHLEGGTIVLAGAQGERVHAWLLEQGAARVVRGS